MNVRWLFAVPVVAVSFAAVSTAHAAEAARVDHSCASEVSPDCGTSFIGSLGDNVMTVEPAPGGGVLFTESSPGGTIFTDDASNPWPHCEVTGQNTAVCPLGSGTSASDAHGTYRNDTLYLTTGAP